MRSLVGEFLSPRTLIRPRQFTYVFFVSTQLEYELIGNQPSGFWPRGVLPYMGFIGMRDPKGYGFSAVLVINRAWFLYSSLNMRIIENKINKSPSQIMFTVI